MLQESKTKETLDFIAVIIFYHWWHFYLGADLLPPLLGYANDEVGS